MTPAYDDGRIQVFHAEHAALAEHVASIGGCDALIVDAPYSARTHEGHDGGAVGMSAHDNARGADYRSRVEHPTGGTGPRRIIGYASWTPADVTAFVAVFSPLTRGWLLSLTDHVLAPAWEAASETAGRYTFSPLACIESGSRVRLGGDGPTQWATWLVAARPRTAEFHAWGSLPGAYVGSSERKPWVGGKPLWLMRALVRDYSRPGDLVVDPCCGAGTTAVACRYEGRRCIVGDCDPAAVEATIRRLRCERLGERREDMPADADHALALFRGDTDR